MTAKVAVDGWFNQARVYATRHMRALEWVRAVVAIQHLGLYILRDDLVSERPQEPMDIAFIDACQERLGIECE